MTTLDLSPLYRSSIGFDQLASILDRAMTSDSVSTGYPPYNIESLGENKYAISLAVAGFKQSDLDINVEHGVLTIRGSKEKAEERNYLHQGIANRSFERKFNLADYVEVVDASLEDGLLNVKLVREIPEAMKPKQIAINGKASTIEHNSPDGNKQAA